jgi:hypothetical protein
MPNWVAQDFHVAGPKAEVDRFIRTGYSRRHRGQFDDLLLFDELCPNRGRERRAPQSVPWLPPSAFARSAPADAPQPWRRRSGGRTRKALDPGVVLGHFRTRTQAMFSKQTRWDYPVEFYNQLPKHWPALCFAASVNEEMGAFGGVIVIVDGEVNNAVRDYETRYDRRAHARDVRASLRRWGAFLTADRPWRLIPHAAWEHRSMPFDAHFDDDFWFYFRTREEMAAFRARYRSSHAMRRNGREWRRFSLPRTSTTLLDPRNRSMNRE